VTSNATRAKCEEEKQVGRESQGKKKKGLKVLRPIDELLRVTVEADAEAYRH